jgi:glycosyltransferase involved in cell wall biosynthesis
MVSVILPIYNESENIQMMYDRLCRSLEGRENGFELLFVNDGSQDQSLMIIQELAAKDARVKYLSFSRNFGHQIAISAGIDHCVGDAIVFIDADGQDPPELIPDLLLKLEEGHEVVYAKRSKRKGESRLKKLTAKWFYRLLQRITHVNIPVDTGDFRAISRKALEVLKQMPEQNKFFRAQIAWIGFQQTYVEYERDERLAGQSGYSYSKMIRLALDGITSFSDWPLKLATLSGFMCAGVGLVLILYTLYSRYVSQVYEPGWASLMITIVFLGGIQLIGIGIIGEYISRINTNVRQRPLYIVEASNISKNTHASY